MDRELASTSQVRVRPRHCDAQAMVHAARYYEFLEDSFLDWLDIHAGGYRQLREQTGVDLVIVSSGCEYRAPARLDDDLIVECQLEWIGRTTIFEGRPDTDVQLIHGATHCAFDKLEELLAATTKWLTTALH